MMRVRLKADGRLVEILADGSERAMPPVPPEADGASWRHPSRPTGRRRPMRLRPPDPLADALTQAEFAARIGVPIETVRNWEQGKRHPRGPARALLKLLDEAPDVAFRVLGRSLRKTLSPRRVICSSI
jgi:putative transcriptional regulator